MRNFVGLVGFLIIFGMFSCQKEVDEALPAKTQSDSTILKKYVEIDSTLPFGQDTITLKLFEYDNAGRLFKTNLFEKNLTVAPTSNYPFHTFSTYFYNGSETVPYKVIISKVDFINNNANDTVYLFYNNSKVIRDSIRSKGINMTATPFEHIGVNKYVDNGTTTTTVTLYFDFTLSPAIWPPACPGTNVITKTYFNGNLTSEMGIYTACSSSGSSAFNAVYDTHPNPLFPYSIPYTTNGGFLLAEQKNNITETWTLPGQDWFKYNYTYRSDGYPLIVRIHDVNNPGAAWKGLFIY